MTSEADGFADLGLWQEAWDTLENLSPVEKATPAALRVRLKCCPGLGAWEIGEHLVKLLRDGAEVDREVAARFYHAVAVYHAKADQMEACKVAIASAVDTWSGIKLALIDDKDLDGVIFPR